MKRYIAKQDPHPSEKEYKKVSHKWVHENPALCMAPQCVWREDLHSLCEMHCEEVNLVSELFFYHLFFKHGARVYMVLVVRNPSVN